jgi:hypothetical protein
MKQPSYSFKKMMLGKTAIAKCFFAVFSMHFYLEKELVRSNSQQHSQIIHRTKNLNKHIVPDHIWQWEQAIVNYWHILPVCSIKIV